MRTKKSQYKSGWRTLLLVAVIAITGIALSVFIRTRIASSEKKTARLIAQSLKVNTRQEILLFAEVLESVRALHALSDAVDQEAMQEFIEKGMVHQRAVLGNFGLAQRIGSQLRSVMEAEVRSGMGTGYIVQQQGSDGNWVPVVKKPVYYPLTWQSRTNGLHIPVGYDFSSEVSNLGVIQRIERTGNTALVPKSVFFTTVDSPAYWVFSPIIPKEFQNLPFITPGTVIGFAAALLEPEQIIKRITERAALPDGLIVQLSISTDEPKDEHIHFAKGSWQYSDVMEALGANWQFECILPAAATGRSADIALIFGLLVTALLATKLLLLGSRTRAIEAEVKIRTEELKIANEQLEKNIQDRALLEEEMSELTASEQRRIGRDLHDSLGQKLTGAVFLSRSLMNHFKSADSELNKHAHTLNETLKSTVTQVRNMARGLASVTLNNENLEESLEQLAEEMSALYNIPCSVQHNGDQSSLTRKAKEQLYFIAREAVNNAARHARAASITIELRALEPSGWYLHIIDDGKGLENEKSAGEGMGLRIMRHRAERIGAEFSARSEPGTGTTIRVSSRT